MARQIRIEFPGAVYHVMARGDRGGPIFADDQDRTTLLETLEQACEKTGWRVHAYVLMGNHYHALIETPEPNLVVGMKWLQGTYTQRFNARHKVRGHLFQGRYRALLVEAEEPAYFGVVSTYIHLNPVRAGLIRSGEQPLGSFPWSSYPEYLKAPQDRPTWLRTDQVLGSLRIGLDDSEGRRGYEAYLEGRVLELGMAERREELEDQWKQIRRGWFLGGDGFRERMLDLVGGAVEGSQRASYMGEATQAHDEHEAEARLVAAVAALGLGPSELAELGKGSPEKQVLAWWLRRKTTVSRQWITARLNMGNESRVTQAARLVEHTASPRLEALKRRLEPSVATEPRVEAKSTARSVPVQEFLD